MKFLEHLRAQPDWKSEDPQVRRSALETVDDPSILSELARNDDDDQVRQKASDLLHGLALEAKPETGLVALEGIRDSKHLVSISRSAVHEGVSRAALDRISDPRALSSVARHGHHVAVCLQALERLTDPEEFGAVAQKTDHEEVALAALDRLAAETENDPEGAARLAEILAPVVQRARSKTAARRARALLRERDPGREEVRSHRETDRPRQVELCETMEALSEAEGCDELAARISQTREAWVDLIPDVDEDLEERFNRAHQSARQQLVRNRIQLAARKQREREQADFDARYLAPRRELCEKAEALQGEQIGKELEAARWEWERLPSLEHDEIQALEQRFRRACIEGDRQFELWQAAQKESRQQARVAAKREERARLQRENLQHLEQLCSRLEQAFETETLTLKQAARGLKKVRETMEAPGPFPSKSDRAAMVKRLKSLHARLYPKVGELRDSDQWKRWANTRVQEQLCADAEALRDLANPLEASRRLIDIQERWRKASTVSRDRAQELWLRFKSARDEVRSRLKTYQAEQAEKKEMLCRQAEELAPSQDWIKTADKLKKLQAEWKTLGPARRSQDKLLWERFRKACDEFFERRKEDLKHRKQGWSKNLQAKEALCVNAESLADSTDWKDAAEAFKKLQSEWKKIGPVGKKPSEVVWARFRLACDRFFERFRRRHEIDRDDRLKEKEGICRELEALIPGGDAPAASSPPPSAPQDLMARLEEIRTRWQKGGSVPGEAAARVATRFNEALGRVISGYPEALSGTELDPQKNLRRMEELCDRVEKLVPDDETLDETAASPAARLAALWVEAMAANTIGGGVTDESRWRAATEDVKRAQTAWQRIGYVPEDARRPLSERFERACRRFFRHRDRYLPSSLSTSGSSRKR